jgi:predicted phage terminase large subunit-like protein
MQTTYTEEELNAFLRDDFYAFIQMCFAIVSPGTEFLHARYIEVLAAIALRCLNGEGLRQIINLPPRYLKSIVFSVALPAYALGKDPTMSVIDVSYSLELAGKLARDCRKVMESKRYRELFPKTRLLRTAEADITTTKGGSRLATSTGGTLTGRGGSLIICDDLMKPETAQSEAGRRYVAECVDQTILSRLNDKRRDSVLVVGQRLHCDDIFGHLLSKNLNSWDVLSMAAIAETEERYEIRPGRFFERKAGEALHPEREPIFVLDRIKAEQSSFVFSAQYQQKPLPLEGEILKWEWFPRYEVEPSKSGNDEIVQSWDTASKVGDFNDYSVCTTWLIKDKKYYLLDVYRERLIYPELKRAIIAMAERFRPNAILIEDKASGTGLIQDIRADRNANARALIAIEPEGDKRQRAAAQSAVIEAGEVFLPRNAAWLDGFKSEIVQFPNGRHDDQIDSMTQCLKWVRTRVIWATEIPSMFDYP